MKRTALVITIGLYALSGYAWAATPPSQAEIDGLVYMREEEKLARDVYQVMYTEWQIPVFNNIATAEQQHMDAVLTLLTRYAVPDPAAGKEPGQFANADLQALYDQLVADGLTGLVQAYTVGVVIEETDIADLTAALEDANHQDIRRVYQNLRNASANHLRAFTQHLSGQMVKSTSFGGGREGLETPAGNPPPPRAGIVPGINGTCPCPCRECPRCRWGHGQQARAVRVRGQNQPAAPRPPCVNAGVRIEGLIATIDVENMRIVVGETVVQVTGDTVIRMSGRAIPFSALALGQTVAACGVMDGEVLVAAWLTVKYGGQ